MAEFDTTGFSAVDAFFGGGGGGDTDKTSDATKSQADISKITSARKNRRQGVGSVVAPQKTRNAELSERLLRVGKKRSRGGDDDDVEDEIGSKNGDDDGDEEEMGRTGIAKTIEKKKDENISSTSSTTMKKKLGKKERMKLKEQEAEKNALSTSGNGESKDESVTQDGGDTSQISGKTDDEGAKKKPKHKRRKVRSKQKNIRKDTRSNEVKPQYRPLTEETRSKMNLPKPKSRNFFVVDRSPAPSSNGGDLTLAIDDLLGEAPMKKKVKSNKTKKSKKKYKNF